MLLEEPEYDDDDDLTAVVRDTSEAPTIVVAPESAQEITPTVVSAKHSGVHVVTTGSTTEYTTDSTIDYTDGEF